MTRRGVTVIVLSAVLAIAFVATVTVAVLTLIDQSRKTGELVRANRAQSAAIQTQRRESIFASCVEQNRRNTAAVIELDTLIARLPDEQQARAAAGRANTVLLINALAPRQPCFERVERLTR